MSIKWDQGYQNSKDKIIMSKIIINKIRIKSTIKVEIDNWQTGQIFQTSPLNISLFKILSKKMKITWVKSLVIIK